MEVVLPEKAELSDLPADMLRKDVLPGLWTGDVLLAKDAYQYFSGDTTVDVDRGGYKEPMIVPKAPVDIVRSKVELA